MSRLSKENLPAFYEYNDVPFLVYTNEDGKPEAVSDTGVISTKLPEIVFEGEEITEAKFKSLGKSREGSKYADVLKFAKSL